VYNKVEKATIVRGLTKKMGKVVVTLKEHQWINSRGKRLSAMVHTNEKMMQDAPVVIFCHGFTGDKVGANQLMRNMAQDLESRGMSVIRFDFAGSGESEGVFALDTTISGWQEDLVNVVSWVKNKAEWKNAPLYLLGHSLGGLITLMFKGHSGTLAGRIALAPVVYAAENFRNIILGDELWEQAVNGQTITNFYNKGFSLEPEFVRELLQKKYSTIGVASSSVEPLLIIHGTADVAVPMQGSQQLYQECSCIKELQIVEGADHVFVGRHGELATKIAVWLKSLE